MRRYTVTVDGTPFTIDVEETAADRFSVTVDGATYDAALEADEDLPGGGHLARVPVPDMRPSPEVPFATVARRRPMRQRRPASALSPASGSSLPPVACCPTPQAGGSKPTSSARRCPASSSRSTSAPVPC